MKFNLFYFIYFFGREENFDNCSVALDLTQRPDGAAALLLSSPSQRIHRIITHCALRLVIYTVTLYHVENISL